MSTERDPVADRRARIARSVSIAKRAGYLALLAASACFVAAAITGFPDALVTLTVVALVAGCVILPVPIVLGYGLRAAEREDRQRRGGDGRGPQR